MVRVWWVNQRRRAYDEEKRLGLIWAPLLNAAGRPLSHWDRMTDVEVGDLILHYHDGVIAAVSTALSPAIHANNPTNDPRWHHEGRMISVALSELDVPIRKDAIPLETRLRFSGPSEPFLTNGDVKQAYLLSVPTALAANIAGLGGFLAEGPRGPSDGSSLAPIRAQGPLPTITLTEDGRTLATYRPEQKQLVRTLFGCQEVARCAFCGRELPVRVLVAAHIKPRAKCSARERADHNIVVPACTLGCDTLFELGYVVVTEGGDIEVGRRAETPSLEDALSELVGLHSWAYTDENATYFRWHRGEHVASGRK